MKSWEKGLMWVLIFFAGLGVLGIGACTMFFVNEQDKAAAIRTQQPQEAPPTQEQRERMWKFVQKEWMTGNRAMFTKLRPSGNDMVFASADLRWYGASLDEKKLACNAIWSYYFKGVNPNGGVWVEDSRSGKHLATFSKDVGLQMEN